jgi:hypothetical protein
LIERAFIRATKARTLLRMIIEAIRMDAEDLMPYAYGIDLKPISPGRKPVYRLPFIFVRSLYCFVRACHRRGWLR